MALTEDQIKKYVQWTREGRSFSEIREDLKKQEFSEEQINRMITEIDEAAILDASTGSGLSRLDWTKIGIAMMALGVLSYFLFFKALHYSGSLTPTIILLGAGGAMIVLGYKTKNKKGILARRSERRQFKRRS